MRWQLQEAKQRFSELVRHARSHGPQVVTRHGEEVAVIVSIEEYRRLTDDLPSFKELLLAAPDLDALEISRSRDPAPVVELAPPTDGTPSTVDR
jgi:prevent-host-death family protein